MARPTAILPAIWLLALSLICAPVVHAQLGVFNEVAVPTVSTPVELGPGRYSTERTFVVRLGQQGLMLDFKANRVYGLQVRHRTADGMSSWSAWSQLHDGPGIAFVDWSPLPFPGPGVYDVEVALVGLYQSGTYPFQVVVVPPAQRAFRSYEHNTYDPRTGTTGTLEHTILVWGGPVGSTALDKPVLVVEGIDASNTNGAEAYYALVASPVAPLFPRAQAQGADLAILDFGDGGRRIQDNAAVVREAITRLRSYSTDRRRSLDVVGISMGGVVLRYALAAMEEEGHLYGVDRFVSVDAPQQGAVIQKSLQDRIHAQLEPADWPDGLARPEGRQLLVYNAFDSGPNDHTAFYNELRALNGGRGYPTLTTNVGVSFGTPDPNPALSLPVLHPDGGPTFYRRWGRLDLDHIFGVGGWNYYVEDEPVSPDVASPGSYLPRHVTQIVGLTSVSLDPAPLDYPVAYEFVRYELADPTFIPYASALDLVGGVSRFDAPVIALPSGAAPSYHDEVPPSLVSPLLQRLGYDLPPPTSVSISGPSSRSVGQQGTWRASTPNPAHGYQYNWEYRTYVPTCDGGSGPGGKGTARDGDASDRDVSESDPAKRSAPDPSGPTTNALPCGEWHDGYGSGAIFPFRGHTDMRLELRVKASGGGGTVTSAVKRVCIGSCGGGGGPLGVSAAPLEGAATVTADIEGVIYETALGPVWPNPTRAGSRASVAFTLADAGPVTLAVYDVLGRGVARLVDGTLSAGPHEASFDVGTLSAGSYVVRLEAGRTVETQVITLTR